MKYGGIDQGTIHISGNPVTKDFTAMRVNGESKIFKYGITSKNYLYLFNSTTNSPEIALEIFDFPTSDKQFYIFIYPNHSSVMMDSRIAAYQCNRQ